MESANKPANDVLRRKLRAEPAEVAEDQSISPARAVRMSLARAADQSVSLALRVGSIRQSRLEMADAVELIEESWALFPIVHDDGSVGALCANPAAAIAFTEQQTMGGLRAGDDAPRDLTRTDRALTQPVADLFLRLFDEAMAGAPTAYWTQGYRCEDPAPTRHMLALQLDATEYRVFDIAIEFVGTERHGQMLLLLPLKSRAPLKSKAKGKKSSVEEPTAPRKKLREAALPAQVELEAVLCRIKLPLSQLRDLSPGVCLPVSRKAMQSAALEDLKGKTSFPVHLGQLHGARAVRITVGTRSSSTSSERDALPASAPVDAAQKQAIMPAEKESAPQSKNEREAQADAELDALLAGD